VISRSFAHAVRLVALLNLAFFGVEFAVALHIGSVSLFADSVDFIEDASVNFLILFALAWSIRTRARVGMMLALILLVPGLATLWTAGHKLLMAGGFRPVGFDPVATKGSMFGRYYERIGLLSSPARTRGNYRAPSMQFRTVARKAFILAVGSLTIASCAPAPPDQKTIAVCRATAAVRAKGMPLTSSDIGELVEECMSDKGFTVIENGRGCTSDYHTAVNRTCYYRNSLLGRLYARFGR